jgi:hypothetical protein
LSTFPPSPISGFPSLVSLVCWGFQGFRPAGPPFSPLMLSPLQWQDLVLVPVIGVVADLKELADCNPC